MKDHHTKTLRTATITFGAVALTILSVSPAFGADGTASTKQNLGV